MKLSNVLLVIVMVLNVGIFLSLEYKSSPKTPVIPEFRKVEKPAVKPAPKPEIYDWGDPKNYEEAVYFSKELKKPLFLYFQADWCSWCKDMKKETLSNPEVKKALSQYVVFYVDFDTSPEIVKIYGRGRLPYYLLVQDDKVIKKTEGYKTPAQFIAWLGGTTPPSTPNPPEEKPEREGFFSRLRR